MLHRARGNAEVPMRSTFAVDSGGKTPTDPQIVLLFALSQVISTRSAGIMVEKRHTNSTVWGGVRVRVFFTLPTPK
jgi:hypothetical protein